MNTIRSKLLVTAAVAVFSSSAMAYTYTTSTLADQMEGNVAYVTGGIGENERAELEAAKPEYSARITSTSTSGAYISDSAIVIYDSRGREVLATNAGPLLWVVLPPGTYKVSAEYQGVVQNKTLRVGKKKGTDLHIVWNVAE
jgi:hypothetical protein